jgi:DNA-binding response OmpR family regulator
MPGALEVLVACSRSEDREALTRILVRRGLKPVLASSVEKSCGILARRPVRLAFCDDELPDGSVGSVLEEIHQSAKRVPVIVISRLENWDEYLRAMRLGAFDYISSPLRRSEVEQVIRRALDELPGPPAPSGHEPDGGNGASFSNGRRERKTSEDGARRNTDAPEQRARNGKHRLKQKGRSRNASRLVRADRPARAGRKTALADKHPASGRVR